MRTYLMKASRMTKNIQLVFFIFIIFFSGIVLISKVDVFMRFVVPSQGSFDETKGH